MITVVTKKPIETDGRVYAIGTVVDSSTWRSERAMLDHRFLRPATPAEAATLPRS